MRQQHKKKGESKDSHWFFCQYCSKRLATRTGKKNHEALPHAADGSFIKKKKPAADTATDQQINSFFFTINLVTKSNI